MTRSSKKMSYVLHRTRSESVFIFLKNPSSSSSSVPAPYKFARQGPCPQVEHGRPKPDYPSHSLNVISNPLNLSHETLAAITRTVLNVIQEKNAGTQDVLRRGRKVRSEKIKMPTIREKNEDKRKKLTVRHLFQSQSMNELIKSENVLGRDESRDQNFEGRGYCLEEAAIS